MKEVIASPTQSWGAKGAFIWWGGVGVGEGGICRALGPGRAAWGPAPSPATAPRLLLHCLGSSARVRARGDPRRSGRGVAACGPALASPCRLLRVDGDGCCPGARRPRHPPAAAGGPDPGRPARSASCRGAEGEPGMEGHRGCVGEKLQEPPRSGWGVLHLLDCLQQGPQASWPLAIARPGFLIAPAQCSRAKCTLGLALRSAGEPKEGAPDPKGLRDCLTIPTPLPGGFQSVWKGYPSLFSLGWARVPVPQGKGLGWSCYVDELGAGGGGTGMWARSTLGIWDRGGSQGSL